MKDDYKVGDLIVLSEFGRLVLDNNRVRIGIIIGGPFNMVYSFSYFPMEEDGYEFICYDIMIGGELITTVPDEFIVTFIPMEDE